MCQNIVKKRHICSLHLDNVTIYRGRSTANTMVQVIELMSEEKKCIYCNTAFSRAQFPRTFNRMITCGAALCAQRRRVELWHNRYEQWKQTRNTVVG